MSDTLPIQQSPQAATSARPAPARDQGRRRRLSRCCDLCGVMPGFLYRVKLNADAPWIAVCPMCSGRALEASSHFVYGGRFVPRRRRRAG